ncbi:unnamed protein product, partial [Didymodactylos carnosus]
MYDRVTTLKMDVNIINNCNYYFRNVKELILTGVGEIDTQQLFSTFDKLFDDLFKKLKSLEFRINKKIFLFTNEFIIELIERIPNLSSLTFPDQNISKLFDKIKIKPNYHVEYIHVKNCLTPKTAEKIVCSLPNLQRLKCKIRSINDLEKVVDVLLTKKMKFLTYLNMNVQCSLNNGILYELFRQYYRNGARWTLEGHDLQLWI